MAFTHLLECTRIVDTPCRGACVSATTLQVPLACSLSVKEECQIQTRSKHRSLLNCRTTPKEAKQLFVLLQCRCHIPSCNLFRCPNLLGTLHPPATSSTHCLLLCVLCGVVKGPTTARGSKRTWTILYSILELVAHTVFNSLSLYWSEKIEQVSKGHLAKKGPSCA